MNTPNVFLFLILFTTTSFAADRPDVSGPNPFWPELYYEKRAREAWEYTEKAVSSAAKTHRCAKNAAALDASAAPLLREMRAMRKSYVETARVLELKVNQTGFANIKSSMVAFDDKQEKMLGIGREHEDACKGSLQSLQKLVSSKLVIVRKGLADLSEFDRRISSLTTATRKQAQMSVDADAACIDSYGQSWGNAFNVIVAKWNPRPKGTYGSVEGVTAVHTALKEHLKTMEEDMQSYDQKLAREALKCGTAASN